eukprot:5754136-Amphidinium_carterae.3
MVIMSTLLTTVMTLPQRARFQALKDTAAPIHDFGQVGLVTAINLLMLTWTCSMGQPIGGSRGRRLCRAG